MQQAPLVDGFAFDPFSCLQDGLAASEIDIGRDEIVEAFVPLGVASNACRPADSAGDCSDRQRRRSAPRGRPAGSGFRPECGFLRGLVPALDLTLDLGMVGRATRVLDALICKPGCQITSDVTWAIVG